MAYVPLDLPTSLPESVRTAIGIGVEPLLEDVHLMLFTPVGKSSETEPPRQLQLPIALVLLATVAGVSKTLLHIHKGTGDRFRFEKCLNKYFPWCIDPPTGVSSECAAEILYKVFRNPLVHSLGLHKSGYPVVRINQVLRGADDPESRVENLERLSVKPFSEPCLVVTPEKMTLWLDPFYWGVRKLVERWSCDDIQVMHADKKLTKSFVE